MRRLRQELRWLGLFMLLPLTVGLTVLDYDIPVSEGWHRLLMGGIILVICLLALRWSERHRTLLETEGVDRYARASRLMVEASPDNGPEEG